MKLSALLATFIVVVFSAGISDLTMAMEIDDFNFNWRFVKGEITDAKSVDFDDSTWEVVDLPHDWAISGPFGPPEASGNQGKLPWQGTGWYRKTFELPEDAEGKQVTLIFDGVMSSPEVYLNGKKIGSWIYGYNSFHANATEAANYKGKNVLAVHVDTTKQGSRWYAGAGIYRKVTLCLDNPVCIPVWGVFVTTPKVENDYATVNMGVEIENGTKQIKTIEVRCILLDPSGRRVAVSSTEKQVASGQIGRASLEMTVQNPDRWDILHPYLYTVETRLLVDGKEQDCETTRFGIRAFTVTPDDGFHLNGRRVQLHGVNLHHDHGPLGAAFFPRAMERQLEIMKDMGVNAIRTSHNMPAPELLEICDRMGLIVYNEAFDKYGASAGVRCGYEEYVEKYAERELRNFVRRDRNHPSVFFWSVGNEVGLIDGEAITAKLVEYVKRYDTSRNISQGFCKGGNADKDRKVLDHLDSSGWNYGGRYERAHRSYPEKPTLYTESASAFGTRGAYKLDLPAGKEDYSGNGECSGFVLTSAPWSDIPEYEFERMSTDNFVAGEFVWTGFDYLGEPTPYNGKHAKDEQGRIARSSYFGIVDLAGLPKDSYYLYRSHWRPDVTTVHISPHWNWQGHEGDPIPVFVYTNGDSAELFLNGRSLGKHRKSGISAENAGNDNLTDQEVSYSQEMDSHRLQNEYYACVRKYRLFWPSVLYEPGELRAVAYKDDERIGEYAVRTAGQQRKLRLTADRDTIFASGIDLSYVTVEMVDENGTVCPWAMDDLSFSVVGPAKLMGVANGNQMGFDCLADDEHPLFYGKAVAVLRSKLNKPGKITLKVQALGKQIESQIIIQAIR